VKGEAHPADCVAGGKTEACPADGTGIEPAPPEHPWAPDCTNGDSWYTTQYLNAVLAARDGTGRQLVLVAGRHGKYFPYFQKMAPWDSILLQLDGQTFTAAAERVDGFEVGLDEAGGTVHLYFVGDALPDPTRPADDGRGEPRAGTTVPILVDLRLAATFHEPRFLGVNVEGGTEAPPPGITMQPVFLRIASGPAGEEADGPGEVSVGLARIGDLPDLLPTAGTGELEVSSISYFKDPSGAFRYDYLCLASPDQGFAFVAFQGHALEAEGAGGEMFEKLLAGSMKRQFTLTADGLSQTNDFGVPIELLEGAPNVLAAHDEDVGLGTMTRQLICVPEPAACGLRESVNR
jgi:hypothetical protein